ncbi:hypothetical protein SYNPS1DRAFT_29690 [Syncephalis pseudoplumigaleata]|uniref:Uncharacterized protein n=1 Tax=Syncephalis pseudoplumigaleata TaxID=1712513 RepID=A0A4P9YWX1_9FUNG|nr:hypothetical protein SYNPS1DRAFT_29690 [Syncephalis pseudoplumigaleata]|eukprot:RKP24547.1 hypothetical protein SYNPS1DRAFT_29690 [Syncephalis pseudoplumigaleata]
MHAYEGRRLSMDVGGCDGRVCLDALDALDGLLDLDDLLDGLLVGGHRPTVRLLVYRLLDIYRAPSWPGMAGGAGHGVDRFDSERRRSDAAVGDDAPLPVDRVRAVFVDSVEADLLWPVVRDRLRLAELAELAEDVDWLLLLLLLLVCRVGVLACVARASDAAVGDVADGRRRVAPLLPVDAGGFTGVVGITGNKEWREGGSGNGSTAMYRHVQLHRFNSADNEKEEKRKEEEEEVPCRHLPLFSLDDGGGMCIVHSGVFVQPRCITCAVYR